MLKHSPLIPEEILQLSILNVFMFVLFLLQESTKIHRKFA